jgi:DNA-directed RNA polymerase beta' subunit
MTRLLTKKEMDSLVSFIKPNIRLPSDAANAIVKKHRDDITFQLYKQKIYPDMIPALRSSIERYYYSSLCVAGESVGVIIAMSLGEKATQNSLNSFHTAGKGNVGVTTGVPRMEEILAVSQNPKSIICTVKMTREYDSIADMRKTIGHSIVELTFEIITKSYEIIVDKKPEKWYEAFKMLYGVKIPYTDCISLKIDMDILYEYQLSLKDVADIIATEYSDMMCVFSPDNIGQLDIFVDTTNIDLPENRLIFVDKDNATEIYIEEVVQPILASIVICGLHGISNIFYTENFDTFETEGSNFEELLGLPFVDSTKTMSNHIWDIYNCLGIEATRSFIISEFMTNMEGINIANPMLLVDKMTFNGTISSVSRYSMRVSESGPISKFSFEESLSNIVQAGVMGQEDRCDAVSASIICGKKAKLGTNVFDLQMDISRLPKSLDTKVVERIVTNHDMSTLTAAKISKRDETLRNKLETKLKKKVESESSDSSSEDDS